MRYIYAPKLNFKDYDLLDLYDHLATNWAIRAEKREKTRRRRMKMAA